MEAVDLYMVILGCTPKGRLTEQHDVFFGVAPSLKTLIPAMIASWPEAEGRIHIDSWRRVTSVDNYSIKIIAKPEPMSHHKDQLFFLNLGGYKPGDLEEYHYKMLVVDKNMSAAIRAAKESAFYRHVGFKGAESHIDDKYKVDIDDAYLVKDILAGESGEYYIVAEQSPIALIPDELHVGYLSLDKLSGSLL